MKKNVASQVIGAEMINATTGAAFTSTVTVYVTGDAGTQAIGSVGSGICTHEGNGFHTYAPAQAETNYDHVAFTFIGTGAIPVTVQLYTDFPQTGDAFARIGAPAGASVSADIAAVKSDTGSALTRLPAALVGGRMDSSVGAADANTITATALATDAVNEIADGVRARQLTESYAADGVAPTLEQALLLIQQMLTEMSISGTTMTIKKLDGTTTAATLTLNDATTPTSVTRAT